MDTRGLGWSSGAPDGDYRKERIADDAIALLDALNLEKAGLLGHDWGGWSGFYAVLNHPERWAWYVASGTAHPWLSHKTVLRALPRFLYQPPIAAPVLGPRIIPPLVSRFIRGGWGEKETYDREAERIYAEAYRDKGAVGSQYYRQFLAREVMRGPSGRLDDPHEAPAGPQRPDRHRDRRRARTSRRRCADAAAGRLRPLRPGGAAG